MVATYPVVDLLGKVGIAGTGSANLLGTQSKVFGRFFNTPSRGPYGFHHLPHIQPPSLDGSSPPGWAITEHDARMLLARHCFVEQAARKRERIHSPVSCEHFQLLANAPGHPSVDLSVQHLFHVSHGFTACSRTLAPGRLSPNAARPGPRLRPHPGRTAAAGRPPH